MFGPLPLLLAVSAAISTPVPQDAAAVARLAEAASRFEEGAFAGEYLRTTRTQILSLSGAVLGEDVEKVRVRMHDGLVAVELVQALDGGRDVTDERRKMFLPVPPAADSGAVRPLAPKGTSLVFTPIPLPSGECGATFSPALTGASGAEGRFAWDCTTLTPLWAELEPTDAPAALSEPRARLDFARAGDVVYPARYTLEGLVADGETTVRIRLVLEISDLTPRS